jgi:hypothetical protein
MTQHHHMWGLLWGGGRPGHGEGGERHGSGPKAFPAVNIRSASSGWAITAGKGDGIGHAEPEVAVVQALRLVEKVESAAETAFRLPYPSHRDAPAILVLR